MRVPSPEGVPVVHVEDQGKDLQEEGGDFGIQQNNRPRGRYERHEGGEEAHKLDGHHDPAGCADPEGNHEHLGEPPGQRLVDGVVPPDGQVLGNRNQEHQGNAGRDQQDVRPDGEREKEANEG